MAQQHRQLNDFQMNSSDTNNNVDDIANRLDQMIVSTDQQTDVNIVEFLDSARQPESAGERMSVDDENVHPNTPDASHHRQHAPPRRSDSKILIVTNVDPLVFNDPLVKGKFESLFSPYDERVMFRYLKSFRRVRLDFTSSEAADLARLNLNNFKLGATAFKCYLAQMIQPNGAYNRAGLEADTSGGVFNVSNMADSTPIFNSDQQQQNNPYLSIPRQSKQFLISPPVSPPAGWKPHDESSPCIDVQLISAIANLVPGQVHEIHPGNESQPGIFVEVCEEKQYESHAGNNRSRIPKTPNPIAAARAAIGQAMRSS